MADEAEFEEAWNSLIMSFQKAMERRITNCKKVELVGYPALDGYQDWVEKYKPCLLLPHNRQTLLFSRTERWNGDARVYEFRALEQEANT